MKDTHADRIGWREFGSGCILTGGMCLKTVNHRWECGETRQGNNKEPA